MASNFVSVLVNFAQDGTTTPFYSSTVIVTVSPSGSLNVGISKESPAVFAPIVISANELVPSVNNGSLLIMFKLNEAFVATF